MPLEAEVVGEPGRGVLADQPPVWVCACESCVCRHTRVCSLVCVCVCVCARATSISVCVCVRAYALAGLKPHDEAKGREKEHGQVLFNIRVYV